MNSQSNQLSFNSLNAIPNQSTWSPFSTPYLFDSTANFSERPNFQYSIPNYQSNYQQNATQTIDKNLIRKPIQKESGFTLNENRNQVNTDSNANFSQTTNNNFKFPKRSEQVNLSDFIRQAERQKAMGGRAKTCTFCKSNGESAEIYTSHSLKDSNDKITCPILLEYSCPVCGAAGEKSHTKKYCPVLQKQLRMQMLQRLTMLNNCNKEN